MHFFNSLSMSLFLCIYFEFLVTFSCLYFMDEGFKTSFYSFSFHAFYPELRFLLFFSFFLRFTCILPNHAHSFLYFFHSVSIHSLVGIISFSILYFSKTSIRTLLCQVMEWPDWRLHGKTKYLQLPTKTLLTRMRTYS